jgi:hypothetical protein
MPGLYNDIDDDGVGSQSECGSYHVATKRQRGKDIIDEIDLHEEAGVPSTTVSGPGHGVSSQSQSRQSTLQGSLGNHSWVKERQRLAEIEIGRTVIECNLSFNILKTPQWKKMIKTIAQVGAPMDGWTGVDYRKMRTVVLDDEIERISKATEPIRNQWKKFGCSILSDGWSDTRRRSIINIVVSSCLGTYFLRAVDARKGGKSITGEFIFRHIRQAIIDVGAENIVQVITDNASNCVAMGKMVEEEFPTICWTPCASHCLDLLIEDIAKLPWINRVMNEARQIVLFFRRKHKALSILREFTDLEVICPSKTRFAYMFIVLERLNLLHDHLRQAVVSHMWIQWNESNLPESQSVQRA